MLSDTGYFTSDNEPDGIATHNTSPKLTCIFFLDLKNIKHS
jgi:hypothetical protein